MPFSTTTLHHLVYQSTATKPFSEAELKALLEQSRAWNTDHQLTGMLLYSDGDIIQVLEGSEPEVKGIFASISADFRHFNVMKLADGPIQQRSFSDWSMGFLSISPDDYRHLTGYQNPESATYLSTYTEQGDGSMHALLSTFVRQEMVRL
jgi:hypothetical protein